MEPDAPRTVRRRKAGQPKVSEQAQDGRIAPGEMAADLARLVADWRSKEQQIGALRSRVEELMWIEEIPVETQRRALTELAAILEQAWATIQAVAAADSVELVKAGLETASEALHDVRWDLVPFQEEQINRIQKAQEEILNQFRAQLEAQQSRVRPLQEALAQARQARAPVLVEVGKLAGFEALIRQADPSLRQQPFRYKRESLRQLTQSLDNFQKEYSPTGNLEEYVGRLQKLTARTLDFTQQVHLLLLRSPLDRNSWFRYEVMLRTPSRQGMHGINVQDHSSLSRQDRDQLAQTIEQIAVEVDGHVRQLLHEQPEDLRDQVRHLVASRRQTVQETPIDLPRLVKETGLFMARVLLPQQMLRFLGDSRSSLTITTNDLELPWEFLYLRDPFADFEREDQAGDDDAHYLCLGRPIARMPMGRAFPTGGPAPIDVNRKPNFLLIYSDPEGNLPNAGREIDTIAASLQSWQDEGLIDITLLKGEQVTGRRLNEILSAGLYDVIHYAGHAYFDEKSPELSGLYLHGREIFSAEKVQRLLEGNPLVFLNACQSALTANENAEDDSQLFKLQRPAEGLASSFIYGGAVGCIGALWPIFDAPAAQFAAEFYQNVLRGYMLGEAMRRARVTIKKAFPSQVTWAAFVLYGDPTAFLVEAR